MKRRVADLLALSNIGSLLQCWLSLDDLPLRPSCSVSPAKTVTKHNGFSDVLQETFSGNDTVFYTDTQVSQKLMLMS